MNTENKSAQWTVILLAENTIQGRITADLLRLALSNEIAAINLMAIDHIPTDRDKQLILIDCSCVTQEMLPSLLERIVSHDRKAIIALLNIKREQPHDDLIMRSEIRGIFYTDTNQDHLTKGMKSILEGEVWFARDILSRYLHRHRVKQACPPTPNAQVLTDKETEILHLLVTGLSNKEIAHRLDISDGTVKTHIYNIFKKIGVKNRVQAANWLQHAPNAPIRSHTHST